MNTLDTKQLKFYYREASSDPFLYVGSMSIKRGDVDYEGHAMRWGLPACEVLCIMGECGYTFNIKA